VASFGAGGPVVVVVFSIPVVGGWLGRVITLFGLGALILEFCPT
jgi:hypothetical protein